MAIYTGPWYLSGFDSSDWETDVQWGSTGVNWGGAPNWLTLNYQWANTGNWPNMGQYRVKSKFELKGDFEIRFYWNRYEEGSYWDTHVKGFAGVYQEVPPNNPVGDLYNHNLRIFYDWQNAYLFHNNTHYCHELIDTPMHAGFSAQIYTIRRRGDQIKIYARNTWTLPAEWHTPDAEYTLESDAPLYFEFAEADGTSSAGGESSYNDFSYSSDGITETATCYIEGGIDKTDYDSSLPLFIWGMPHPPTGHLGSLSLYTGGPGVENEGMTLAIRGVESPIFYHSEISEQSIIHDHEYFPKAPPAITEEFESGGTVTLSLWTAEGRLSVAILSNVWSTANIAVLPIVTMQYMWAMTDGTTTKAGHFRLTAHEAETGKMPRPGEEDTFIRRL